MLEDYQKLSHRNVRYLIRNIDFNISKISIYIYQFIKNQYIEISKNLSQSIEYHFWIFSKFLFSKCCRQRQNKHRLHRIRMKLARNICLFLVCIVSIMDSEKVYHLQPMRKMINSDWLRSILKNTENKDTVIWTQDIKQLKKNFQRNCQRLFKQYGHGTSRCYDIFKLGITHCFELNLFFPDDP